MNIERKYDISIFITIELELLFFAFISSVPLEFTLLCYKLLLEKSKGLILDKIKVTARFFKKAFEKLAEKFQATRDLLCIQLIVFKIESCVIRKVFEIA